MDFDVIIHEDPKYVEIISSGIADKDGSFGMSQAISDNMRKHRLTRALIDHRNIEAFEGKIIEIYKRPRLLVLMGTLMKIRIAEIIRPEHTEHFKFLETVLMNQGFSFTLFYEREEALKWLFK